MAKKIDSYLTFLVFFLSVIGILNFFSASYYYSLVNYNNPNYYFFKFLIRITLLGIITYLLGNFFGRNLSKFKKFFLLIFFIIYLSIFLGFISQFKIGGTARFVKLGFISFQPSELIKPFAILFFIFLILSVKKFSLIQKNLFFIFFLLALILPIYFQPSLSNVLIIASSISIIFFKSLNSKKELFFSFLIIFVLFLGLLAFSFFWGYRQERLISFFTKGKIFSEKYFQVERSILGVSSGGLLGKGLGKSEIKILGLPQIITDSIFVVFAEERGFIGSIILIISFLILILRIIYLGKKETKEKELFSLALSVWLFLQTFLHISSNIGLFVPTGVVLPFFSYGPSAQLAIYFSLGIVSSFRR